MNSEALKRAKIWASDSAFDQETRDDIQALIDKNDVKEIEDRFYRDLEFGTGGMRSVLGNGTNRMNKYNVRKASHAVSLAIKKTFPDKSDLKVAISYDSRKYSPEFAQEAASVYAANGIKALIYKRLNPVSFTSFATRHFDCQAGVMVTASHNPPEYNGYKVFWADGAQVTPPNDKNIIDEFNSLEDFGAIPTLDFEEGLSSGKIAWLGEKEEDLYYDAIKSKAILPDFCKENGDKIKIIYTAIHGTGSRPCVRALSDIGIKNVIEVESQKDPDHRFPTVSSPNPENEDALALAVELMEKENADIALGTDPDTDRVGIALRHEGRVQYLNGNQIGILLLNYMMTTLIEQNKVPSNPYFVKTIVTSTLQEKIARHFGLDVENTLTGFKWMCGKMNQIEQESPERNFVFATEESFGYLNHEFVRDKDGVSSIALIGEMALWYKTQGLNLFEGLDKIYEEFGFSHEALLALNYYGKEGAEKIERIMNYFRNYSSDSLFGKKIDTISDVKAGVSRTTDGKEKKLDLPTSNVLGFKFLDGDSLWLRPSGTEPKIKFYTGVQVTEGDLEQKKKQALNTTDQILNELKEIAEAQ